MLVRECMAQCPRSLHMSESIRAAARLFQKYKMDAVPILDDKGFLCGILTPADIINAVVDGCSAVEPVGQVMTRSVTSVRSDDSLDQVRKARFKCLPVISVDNRVVGMISSADILNAYEKQLQQSTDEVRALINSAHEGIIGINAFGIVTIYNEAVSKLVGLSTEEALGRTLAEVMPNSGLKRVLETGQAERDCEFMLGGRTVISNRSPVFQGCKVVGALGIMQDASEFRELVTQLLDVQNHIEDLQTVFETAHYGIVVVDDNGIILRLNKAYEDIFNVDRDDLVGRPVIEMIEDTKLHMVARTGIPEFGEIQNFKGRQIIVNRIPIFKNGKISGAIGEALFKDISEVSYLLNRVQHLERQVSRYRRELDELSGNKDSARQSFASIIGSSRILTKTKNLALRAAQSDNNVLLLGESGTGKELFARAIHNASKRYSMPLIAINCAAVPADLLESELFGYDEGAFTGAKKGGKKGKFELADKGMLFLDEIGDMPLPMQAKILRVIEDSKIDRIGGNKSVHCNVRIIAATNKPLTFMVKQGTFREDLFYRLNVIRIHLPPLRDRREDIGEHIETLLPEICRASSRPIMQFAPETMELIREYSWPGNVRELMNLLKQLAATVESGIIMPHHLLDIDKAFALNRIGASVSGNEQSRVSQALTISKGNKALAAKLLGWHRSTLYAKLKKFDTENQTEA
ncbi:MAG: sigma 54-interacting transcriptional regulator [Negativicutes bacterium]